MIYVRHCPKCSEVVSFLNNEDSKVCKSCGEVVFNIIKMNEIKENEKNQENKTSVKINKRVKKQKSKIS